MRDHPAGTTKKQNAGIAEADLEWPKQDGKDRASDLGR
jgi:hypothetical protein